MHCALGNMVWMGFGYSGKEICGCVYSETSERHCDVPADGMDGMCRAYHDTSIRSSGGDLPIFQSVRGGLSVAYWSAREYISPCTITSGTCLAKLFDGLHLHSYGGFPPCSLIVTPLQELHHCPPTHIKSSENQVHRWRKNWTNERRRTHACLQSRDVCKKSQHLPLSYLFQSIHIREALAVSSHRLIFCGHMSRMDKKGETQCVCCMSYGPGSVCQSWA